MVFILKLGIALFSLHHMINRSALVLAILTSSDDTETPILRKQTPIYFHISIG